MDKLLYEEKFKNFLITFNEGAETKVRHIRGNENLFNAGLIDSFRLPRIIRFLEEISGDEIPIEKVTIEAFYTIDTIYETFLGKDLSLK